MKASTRNADVRSETLALPQVSASADGSEDKFLSPSRLTILPIVFLGILVAGTFLGGQASVLGLLFPAVAIAFGLLLVDSNPAAYLSLSLWLWILTPELRRLMDAQVGYNPTNPIMLAPYLVAGLTAIPVLGQFRKIPRGVIFPFFVVFAGVFVGFAVGLVRTGPFAATYGLLDWLIPPLLACYLVVKWTTNREQVRLLVRFSIAALIVLGAYGLYQFFLLPGWDANWILNSPVAGSIGRPVAQQLRVFSTLNSPGPFAIVVMVLLLMVGARANLLKAPAIAIGGLGLALSLVRSAWLGAALGATYLFSARSQQKRLLNAGLLGLLAALVILTPNPIGGLVAQRLQTMQTLSGDYSFQARLAFYGNFGVRAFADPAGAGIGATGTASKLSTVGGDLGQFGNFDSGLLEIPFVLGWLGTLLFAGGGVALVRRALNHGSGSNRIASACRAILGAAAIQLLFSNVLRGVSGVFIWIAVGLALASQLSQQADAQQ